AVLRQWGDGKNRMAHGECAPLMGSLRQPRLMLEALRCRWPTPIYATVAQRGPFNELPRLPFQVATCLDRVVSVAARRLMAVLSRFPLRAGGAAENVQVGSQDRL